MSYRVFARKYRPRTFDEVVGQEHITRTLQNALGQNRIAQAYLFVGPRGIGKTSTARILAKAMNCLQGGPTATPCCECEACREIAEGNSLDVLEIDGASNNGVEHIRELRETVSYAPARGPFKVYIVDEVHMLSISAFNALLKTLEEPPAHVKFIFATTEAQKVPPTIVSRCQRFDLRRIPAELIEAHLQKIAGLENITLEEDAARFIARGADGGLRDAESMLDQAVAFCGDKITGADVLSIFGFTGPEVVQQLAEAIFRSDTAAALGVIASQAEAGKDFSRLLTDLISHMRDLLVTSATGSAPEGLPPVERLLELIDHLAAVEGRIRWAPDKKLHLDVAIIKAVHLLEQTTLDDVIDTLAQIRGGGTPVIAKSARSLEKTKPSVPPPSTAAAAPASKPQQSMAAPQPQPPPPASSSIPEASGGVLPPETTRENESEVAEEALAWDRLAKQLAHDAPLRCNWLTTAVFVACVEGRLTVEIPSYEAHNLETIFWSELKKQIEESWKKATGIAARLDIRVVEATPPPPEPEPEHVESPVAAESVASPPPAPAAEPTSDASSAPSADIFESFRNDPVIKKALATFQQELQTSSS